MAIPKKGSRKITIGSITYRWAIRKKPTYDQAIDETRGLKAVVELFEEPVSVLHIDFHTPRNDSWIFPGKVEISPGQIANCVNEALRLGWEPSKNGGDFEVVHRVT